MPFGVKDPLKYNSKRTDIVVYPKEVGKCCLCGKGPRELCPVHLKSLKGLLCTFACSNCYKRHRANLSIDYESIMIGDAGSNMVKKVIRNSFKTKLPVGQGSSHRASCVAPKTSEMMELICDIRSRLDRLTTLVLEASELEIPVEASEYLPEETLLPNPGATLIPLDSEEFDDDDLEFGMTDEQRAQMDEAVKQAEARTRTVIESTHD